MTDGSVLPRLEAEVTTLRRDFDRFERQFGPLAGEVLKAAVELRHATEDIGALRAHGDEQYRRLESQVTAVAEGLGGMQRDFREALHEAERERLKLHEQIGEAMRQEREMRVQESEGRVTSRRNQFLTLCVALITALGGVVAALVTRL